MQHQTVESIGHEAIIDTILRDKKFSSLRQSVRELQAHPFFKRCTEGTITKTELHHFIVQHHFYAKHFMQYLFSLMGRLDDVYEVKQLMENVLEEMDVHGSQQIPHSVLYQNLMVDFGLCAKSYSVNHCTQQLVDAMFHSCRHPNPLLGLSALCLGAEMLVPMMYERVIQGCKACGYRDEQLEYFYLHVSCDDDHALTLYQLIKDRLCHAPDLAVDVRAVAERMIILRSHFFTDVIRSSSQVPDIRIV